ncbi:MAG: late competence development ComFB family protein [Gammaproteobacteria bacterium]
MPFDAIHNYYEPLVHEAMLKVLQNGETLDADALEDVACVALNQLPARYVRHTVDMVYYMTRDEREKIEQDVAEAVKNAFTLVKSHRHSRQEQ